LYIVAGRPFFLGLSKVHPVLLSLTVKVEEWADCMRCAVSAEKVGWVAAQGEYCQFRKAFRFSASPESPNSVFADRILFDTSEFGLDLFSAKNFDDEKKRYGLNLPISPWVPVDAVCVGNPPRLPGAAYRWQEFQGAGLA
jgi:hypothetical protein